ncbi:MAG: NUDIX hydrolase [Sphingomonadales bacterium]
MSITDPKPPPARPAATILLVRDSHAGIEVLMVERHANIEFAGGALVFPGGRVGRWDHDRRLLRRLRHRRVRANRADRAFMAAAVRELFEETGMLLACDHGGGEVPEQRRRLLARRFQAQVEQGRRGIAEVLRAGGLWLDAAAVVPFAHWVTPVTYSKRFDTRFFIARAPRAQTAVHDGGEMVHSLWLRPQDALALVAAGRHRMMFPTRMNLLRLAESRNVADALRRARQRPLVPVLPEIFEEGGRIKARVPRAAGYGEVLFRDD